MFIVLKKGFTDFLILTKDVFNTILDILVLHLLRQTEKQDLNVLFTDKMFKLFKITTYQLELVLVSGSI